MKEHTTITRLSTLLMGAFLLGSGASAFAAASSEGIEFFESRIRPVLIERCYKCHSATSEKLKGGLKLDSREDLLKGGDDGVVGRSSRERQTSSW